MRRLNIESVRFRRNHRTTSFRRRQSICSSSELSQNECGSNANETSATSSISFVRYFPSKRSNESSGSEKTFLDHGPGVDVDCTREIFAKHETEKKVPVKRARDGSLSFTHGNCDDTDIGRDSLKYYTKPVKVVIDRGSGRSTESFIHTTTAQMFIGDSVDRKDTEKGSPSDVSILSEFNQRSLRANMACEDLVNLDDLMNIKGDSKKSATIDERHSMPTLFVGNRFNCSSLTEVFIPSYAENREMKTLDKDSNQHNCIDDTNNRYSNTSTTTTHSSSVDIPPLVPAPDKLSIELMYNLNNSPPDTHHIVIKPPSMFDSRRTLNEVDPSSNPIEQRSISHCNLPNILRLEAGDKRTISFKHFANDQDDCFRSPHNKQNSDKTLNLKKKCGCCVQSHSPCVSQRSSDSGMAGSCTISPDAPILNTENEYDPLDERFLPDIQQRLNSLMHSHSSQNFGQFENIPFVDSNHDSGQYGCNDESESEQHRDSNAVKNMFELSSSQDTVRRKSRCQSAEPQIEPQTVIDPKSSTELLKTYKTGMYAHWWKKTQLPSAILRDIYRTKLNKESNSSSSQQAPSNSRGSGKPIFVLDLVVFSLCSAHYVLLYALTIFFCFHLSHPVECSLRLPSFQKFHTSSEEK